MSFFMPESRNYECISSSKGQCFHQTSGGTLWSSSQTEWHGFPKHLEAQLLAIQKECMPDDSVAGMVQVYLDDFKGDYVCSLQLYQEALKNKFDKPNAKELRELNDIMNNSVIGWRKCKSQRRLDGYGQQRAWERIKPLGSVNETSSLSHGFEPVTEQMNLPFD